MEISASPIRKAAVVPERLLPNAFPTFIPLVLVARSLRWDYGLYSLEAYDWALSSVGALEYLFNPNQSYQALKGVKARSLHLKPSANCRLLSFLR
jgi:hypothetical protein